MITKEKLNKWKVNQCVRCKKHSVSENMKVVANGLFCNKCYKELFDVSKK